MDVLLSAAAMLALSVPIGFAFALFVTRGPDLMAGFFGPIRYDGWPRGVQEEDPSFDTTFRLGPTRSPPTADADVPPVPCTPPVRYSVRRR